MSTTTISRTGSDLAGLVELCDGQARAIAALQLAKRADGAGRDARQQERAMVAHELRNPLTVIFGLLDLLTETELPVEALEMVSRCQRQALHLRDIVNDQENQSENEVQVPRLPTRSVTIAALVADVCVAAGPDLTGRDLIVEVPTDMRVDTVPSRLRQILLNLVINAARHTPEGTPIDVSAARLRDVVVLTVADRGPGLDGAQEDMCQPFRRGHSTSAAGEGIGLYVVTRLVESLNGDLRLLPRPGGGLLARVSLASRRKEDRILR